jgi:hypothetical protein
MAAGGLIGSGATIGSGMGCGATGTGKGEIGTGGGAGSVAAGAGAVGNGEIGGTVSGPGRNCIGFGPPIGGTAVDGAIGTGAGKAGALPCSPCMLKG